MENMVKNRDKEFWKGKRVLVTGHTGFKGTWMCKMLKILGADVTGYALPPKTDDGKSFFSLAEMSDNKSMMGDVKDFPHLSEICAKISPEIVFHLAAQPIVSIGYEDPLNTYATNVMGTVHILECVRRQGNVKSVVIVTTDKVYKNYEWVWGYRETDMLGGRDPYAGSKSCVEIATNSYKESFLESLGTAVSTVRAGNVIGGGDFSVNRVIPDCIRAAYSGKDISIRNPNSVRPYQHVLEPLTAYLLIAQKQYEDKSYAGSYNIGPREDNCITTGELADLFCRLWDDGIGWQAEATNIPHESRVLRLDCSLFQQHFHWHPCWDIETAVSKTVEFAKVWLSRDGGKECMERQIRGYWEECAYE